MEPVSIDQIDLSDISLYPNPTSSMLNVESEELEVEKITIYDIIGRMVLQRSLSNNFVNLSSLENGIYLAEVEDKNRVKYIYKIVKE